MQLKSQELQQRKIIWPKSCFFWTTGFKIVETLTPRNGKLPSSRIPNVQKRRMVCCALWTQALCAPNFFFFFKLKEKLFRLITG